MGGGGVEELDNKANSVQLQLPTGTELGKKNQLGRSTSVYGLNQEIIHTKRSTVRMKHPGNCEIKKPFCVS